MVKIREAYLTVRVIVGECETFPRKARKGKVTWTVKTRDSLPPHTYNSQESERLRLHCIKLWLGRGGKRQPCSTQYHPYSRTNSINNRQETVTVITHTSVCRKNPVSHHINQSQKPQMSEQEQDPPQIIVGSSVPTKTDLD